MAHAPLSDSFRPDVSTLFLSGNGAAGGVGREGLGGRHGGCGGLPVLCRSSQCFEIQYLECAWPSMLISFPDDCVIFILRRSAMQWKQGDCRIRHTCQELSSSFNLLCGYPAGLIVRLLHWNPAFPCTWASHLLSLSLNVFCENRNGNE